MKKDDFWVLTLITLMIIAVVIGWSIWLKIAVIANSILILIQIGYKIYKGVKSHG